VVSSDAGLIPYRTEVERAQRILRAAGVESDEDLTRPWSWSNEVWLNRSHVVRIASEHGPKSLLHELAVAAVLPDDVPYPQPFASGWDDDVLWVVTPRIGGVPLYEAFAAAGDDAVRTRLVAELARSMRALHRVALPAHLAHPPAMGDGPPVDVTSMPEAIRRFVAETCDAKVLPAATGALILDRLAVAEDALDDEPQGCVHTDLSFPNAMWDGDRVWLLDLEWACMAPIDYELLWLLSYCDTPASFVGEEWEATVSAVDHSRVPAMLATEYPDLFAHPRLADRVTTYGIASFARGWLLRPDVWHNTLLDPHPSEMVRRLAAGERLIPLLPERSADGGGNDGAGSA
jgi:aminoglycoside phosphotransferase